MILSSIPVFFLIRVDLCPSVATSSSLPNAFNERHGRMRQDVGPEVFILVDQALRRQPRGMPADFAEAGLFEGSFVDCDVEEIVFEFKDAVAEVELPCDGSPLFPGADDVRFEAILAIRRG